MTGILRVSSSYVNLLGLSPKCGPRILGGRRGLHLSPLKATSVIPVTAPGYAPRTSEMGVVCAGPRSPVSSLRAHSPATQSSPVRAIVKPDRRRQDLLPLRLSWLEAALLLRLTISGDESAESKSRIRQTVLSSLIREALTFLVGAALACKPVASPFPSGLNHWEA